MAINQKEQLNAQGIGINQGDVEVDISDIAANQDAEPLDAILRDFLNDGKTPESPVARPISHTRMRVAQVSISNAPEVTQRGFENDTNAVVANYPETSLMKILAQTMNEPAIREIEETIEAGKFIPLKQLIENQKAECQREMARAEKRALFIKKLEEGIKERNLTKERIISLVKLILFT